MIVFFHNIFLLALPKPWRRRVIVFHTIYFTAFLSFFQQKELFSACPFFIGLFSSFMYNTK